MRKFNHKETQVKTEVYINKIDFFQSKYQASIVTFSFTYYLENWRKMFRDSS